MLGSEQTGLDPAAHSGMERWPTEWHVKGTLDLALRRTVWFGVALGDWLSVRLAFSTDRLSFVTSYPETESEELTGPQSSHSGPSRDQLCYGFGKKAHCKATHCPYRLKIPSNNLLPYRTRASLPPGRLAVQVWIKQAWVCSSKSSPEPRCQQQNTRASFLGL